MCKVKGQTDRYHKQCGGEIGEARLLASLQNVEVYLSALRRRRSLSADPRSLLPLHRTALPRLTRVRLPVRYLPSPSSATAEGSGARPPSFLSPCRPGTVSVFVTKEEGAAARRTAAAALGERAGESDCGT